MAGRAYDPGARRQSVRRGRERGCWVYIPAEELDKAIGAVPDSPPAYRVWGLSGRTVMVKVYDTR